MFGPVDLRPDSGRRCGGAVVHGRRRDLLDRCILPMIGNPLIAICSWPKRQSRFGDRPITETIFDINTAADDCTKGSIHITKLFSLVINRKKISCSLQITKPLIHQNGPV
jgi:hypothetical protein